MMPKIQADPKDPTGSGGGNTNSPPVKQIAPAKKWVFTLNNYTEDDILLYRSKISELCRVGGVGLEVGESGTEHLQGFLEFKVKSRPIAVFGKGAHWEKMKGTIQENITYCSKEGKYWFHGHRVNKPLKLITELRPWQADLLKKLEEEPDERTINWYWERKGRVGKTAMCKLLCAKYGAILTCGKAADMKYMIVKYIEENDGAWPTMVLFDVPRESMNFLSYPGMEEIKNGLFASPKYESQMCIMNCPHVVVFANSEPDYSAMSADRWNVVNMDEPVEEIDEICEIVDLLG